MRIIAVALVFMLAAALARAAALDATLDEKLAEFSAEIEAVELGAAAVGAPQDDDSNAAPVPEDTPTIEGSSVEISGDGEAASARAGLSTAACTPSVALLTLVTFFGGASVVLLMAVVMNYRLLAAMSGAAGYVSLEGGKPELSRAQRAALIIATILVIAATITVAVVFSVLAPAAAAPAAAAAAGTTARAGETLQSVSTSSINAKRASLRKGLPNMGWNAADASVAQGYVNRCPGLVHNANRGRRGENIYVYSAAGGDPNAHMRNAINAWWAEQSFYNYATNKCQAGKMCGHYTQLAWKSTTGVGCGVRTNCPGTWKTQVVCNFSPPGNFIGQRPY